MSYALISVSDKTGVVDFARGIAKLGFQILSSGGTFHHLVLAGVQCTEVSEYTGSPEMFGGRVKTLHPKVFGGILYRRDIESDVIDAVHSSVLEIELVCVNLYPFGDAINRTDDFGEIIENIDIGGPSLVRAAAKNFQSVYVVVDPRDYDLVLGKLSSLDETGLADFRRELMIKAFSHTASYDICISNYMNRRLKGGLGSDLFIHARKAFDTSYGENPHQIGALYEFGSFFSDSFRILKGNVSFNNVLDIHAALKLVTSFDSARLGASDSSDTACTDPHTDDSDVSNLDASGRPAAVPVVAIIKHGNPCGFSMGGAPAECLRMAMLCDPVSAYGGVIALSVVLDEPLALKLSSHFFEVVIAPKVTESALAILSRKKRLRICEVGSDGGMSWRDDMMDMKKVEHGILCQTKDSVGENEVRNSVPKTSILAGPGQLRDMEIGLRVCAMTKSNCISFVRDSTLLAIGMGMTSRVDSIRAAISKSKSMSLDLRGSVMVSEAFFPFKDSVELAHSVGVSAILQPGGSIRDEEVVSSAQSLGIAMYFSGVRHFLH